MMDNMPGLGGFPRQPNQMQKRNQNPNAAFNRPTSNGPMQTRPMGMQPRLGNPQAPPPVQNRMPVNTMERPQQERTFDAPQLRMPPQQPVNQRMGPDFEQRGMYDNLNRMRQMQQNPEQMNAYRQNFMQRSPMIPQLQRSELPPQVMMNPAATNMQEVLMRLRNNGY